MFFIFFNIVVSLMCIKNCKMRYVNSNLDMIGCFLLMIFITVLYQYLHIYISYPADNYMFKVNIRNTRIRCEICSKLTTKTPE